MPIRIVRLGSPRHKNEGTRIGTVRRPPRGVPKAEFATQNWYDVWFPNLAPSIETVKLAQKAATPAAWAKFARSTRPSVVPGSRPLARASRRAVTKQQLLCRLLLRGRSALSSLGATRPAHGKGCRGYPVMRREEIGRTC